MKVVYIVASLDEQYGGPAQCVPALAREIRSHGHEVVLVSANWNRSFQENSVIEADGLPWVKLERQGPLKINYVPKLESTLSTHCTGPVPTVLHLNTLWNHVALAAYRIARKTAVPLVISLHGTMSDWAWSQRNVPKRTAWQLFQRKMLNEATCVHATADMEYKDLRRRGISNRCALISNGVDTNYFSALPDRYSAKTNLGLTPDARYLLFLSRLHPKKRIEMLFSSWAKIQDTVRSGWKILIAGGVDDPAYRRQLDNSVKDLGLVDDVIFTGALRMREKLYAYAAADAFVLPSFSENFGIVVAEALASGLPVITTHGTPWNMLESRGAGYYVPCDEESLRSAIMRVLNSSEHDLKKMGLRGIEIAAEYSWEAVGKQFLDLYEWALNPALRHAPDTVS